MRSLPALIPARFRKAAVPGLPVAPARRPAPRRRQPPRTISARLGQIVARRGFGSALAVLLLSSAAAYGFVRGGHFETFIADAGRPADIAARLFGFGVSVVAISGNHELQNAEILDASGITPRDSVLFLDANAVRQRLKAVPLVRDASVRKLYPDQVVLIIDERTPHALWQIDGEVSIVAADGTAIDQMRDQRFTRLPFVVGEGANERVKDYVKLLEAAGDFRSRIVAGVLVGQRRWNLKLNNGVDVRLPEDNPEAAVKRLATLARENKLPDKDIIAIDLRMAGRITVRLSEDAAAQRIEAKTKKTKPRGGAA
jgi:cell division protein FtsQ